MQKPTKAVRCTYLNGSAWCTEKKYMRRYKDTFDIFFGIEHRVTRETWRSNSTQNSSNDEGLQLTWRMITHENASSEDRNHTSGGVFVAIDREQLLQRRYAGL